MPHPSSSKPFYLTTPLYYVNDKPHIGHAYTNILCDTIARFKRFQGYEVFFLTGTDEHGEKIDRTAKKQGIETKTFVDQVVLRFIELWKKLDITYDFFIRTTDEFHKRSVQTVLQTLEKKGDIYRAPYKGWYCTPCESFWTPGQLQEGKCPDCRREVAELEEENYFFRMSKYHGWLKDYIMEHKEFIQPDRRRNEVLGFLSEPLEDLCITRPKSRLTWGIPYPGSSEHVFYVWFDALTNYISAVGYGQDSDRFERLWPADLHMVGKDIIRQHAVYWTIMLQALGVKLPRTIFAHGWWTIQGAKVSKSLGNIVDPAAVGERYSVDGLRYYFLHEVTLGSDGAYSEVLLTERYNKDLADDLGNLVRRTLTMAGRYLGGKFPDLDAKNAKKQPQASNIVEKTFEGLADRLVEHMNRLEIREALEEIWMLIRSCNRYIDETKPWALAKDPSRHNELCQVLGTLLEALRVIGVALTPFLPATAKSILEQLHCSPKVGLEDLKRWSVLKSGTPIDEPTVLFPKIEMEESKNE